MKETTATQCVAIALAFAMMCPIIADAQNGIRTDYSYDFVDDFIDGFARVQQDGKWGFIDNDCNLVIPLIYDNVSNFSEGLAGVEKNRKWGFINSQGIEVISCNYDLMFGVEPESECAYEKTDDNSEFYLSINSFHDGLARIQKDTKNGIRYGFINTDGDEIIPLIYTFASDFSDGLAIVEKNKGVSSSREGRKCGAINTQGLTVIPFDYDYISDFHEDLAVIRKETPYGLKYGYINKYGKEVIPCKYSYAYFFEDGIAKVMIDQNEFYINKQGQSVDKLSPDVRKRVAEEQRSKNDMKKAAGDAAAKAREALGGF